MLRAPATQRGFLLIVAVVLIVVVGLLAAVITFLSAGNVLSGAGHASSAKALFVAESGMERALYGFKAGTSCASLSLLTPPSTVGEGDFNLLGTLYNPVTPVTIAVDIGTTDTVIPVSADPRTSGYATHGRLTIGTEALSYASVATTGCSGAPACFTGVTRGVAGTTAVNPAVGDAVLQNQCVIRSTGTVGSAKRIVERAVSSSGGSSRAMAVYAKLDGDRVPYYRLWDGTAWGAEATALSVGTAGNDIRVRFMVLKFARTRNEALLGIQYLDNTTGGTEISVQRWNGTSWVGLTTLVTGIGGGDDDRRGFDIEYETANDRAMVVYRLAGNNTEDPDFRIWDGSSWTAAVSIGVPTTRAPRWIELAPNPVSTSNEIAMMLVDRNDDVYGMAWTGAAWSDMGVAAIWDDADDSVTKTIDVAYEQQSGEAMFIWANDSDDDQNYRLWNGTSLTGFSTLTISAMSGSERGEWLRLAPQTGTNNMLYGVQDQGGDLNTRFWNGGAWDGAGPHPEHDSSVEDTSDRNFDIVFETYAPNTHLAWLVWGNGATVSRKQWNSNTSSWGGTTTTGDDTALVQLMAHPTSGVVLSAIYEDRGDATNDDLREMHLPAGGAWSTLTNPSVTATDPFWAGQTVNMALERVTLAPYRFGFDIYDWIEMFP